MKLGLVNKFDQRNKTTSKKIDDSAISENRDVKTNPLNTNPTSK